MKTKVEKKSSPNAGAKANKNAKVTKKETSTPVLNAGQKKKLAALANSKQKLVQENQNKVLGIKDKEEPKQQMMKKGQQVKETNTGKQNKPMNPNQKKDVSAKSTNGTNSTSEPQTTPFKAFVGFFPAQATEVDVKAALTGAGIDNIEFITIIRSRKGAVATISFTDQDSLNEAIKLSNEVEILNTAVRIEVYRGRKNKQKNTAGTNKAKGKSNKKNEAEDSDDDEESDEEMDVDKPKQKAGGKNGLNNENEKKFRVVIKCLTNSTKIKQIEDALSENDLLLSKVVEIRKGKDVHAIVTFPDEENMKKALNMKQITVNDESLDIAQSLGPKKRRRGKGGKNKSPNSQSSPAKNKQNQSPSKNNAKQLKKSPQQAKKTPKKKSG